jgi:hypothetical protein
VQKKIAQAFCFQQKKSEEETTLQKQKNKFE